eukprot:4142618-Pleurochrysis_carterae.AAC.1
MLARSCGRDSLRAPQPLQRQTWTKSRARPSKATSDAPIAPVHAQRAHLFASTRLQLIVSSANQSCRSAISRAG